MKRIQAACIEQIIHFLLKEDIEHDTAIQLVKEEYASYKRRLERAGIRYKLVAEETLPDGSIQIRIKKQYSTSPVGEFLN